MKYKLLILFLAILAVIFIASKAETAKANNHTNIVRLELGNNVENLRTINVFNYNDHSLTLVFFERHDKHYMLIHSYSRFKKDKLIYIYPHYKVFRINRQDLISKRNDIKYFKTVE